MASISIWLRTFRPPLQRTYAPDEADRALLDLLRAADEQREKREGRADCRHSDDRGKQRP